MEGFVGELIHLKLASGGLAPARSWRANEIDRLHTIANVAAILVHLVEIMDPERVEADRRAIELGRHVLTSLALLDLSPDATAGREDAVLRRADCIEDLIRNWKAMIAARSA